MLQMNQLQINAEEERVKCMSILGLQTVDEVGSGATATVYHVKHEKDGHFAAKVITIARLGKDWKGFLDTEVNCWQQLRHESISELLGHCYVNNHLVLISEFSPLGDLRGVLKEYGFLKMPYHRFIFSQLLDALAYMHSIGIAHRDIKPDNVLRFYPNRVKLTDFGVACQGKDTSTQYVGTGCYKSPKVISSRRYNVYKNDVFGMGVTFYECFKGIVPDPPTWDTSGPFNDFNFCCQNMLLWNEERRLSAAAVRKLPYFAGI